MYTFFSSISYFSNLVILLRKFVNFFSANISGEEVKSNLIVNTGVISLSTNPKIYGTFDVPLVISLQYNQVRI